MTAVLLGRVPVHSDEWYAMRSKGIGGSEIAAVVGLSPWVSRYSLWHRKRGTIPAQDEKPGMEWGTRLEGAVCRKWAENHPGVGLMEGGTYRHKDRPWQLGNPDRLLIEGDYDNPHGLLEVKTAHQYDAHEWGQGDEDIPPYYRCQAVWYMDVLDLPVAHVAVLIGGSDYREYQIPYVADEAEYLREQGYAFWQTIVNDEPPAIDGHTATYEAVRKKHPEIERGEEVEIDRELYARYVETKPAETWAKTAHLEAKSAVLDVMGQANYAQVDGESVLRRQSGRGDSVSLYEIKKPKEQAA